MNSVRIGEVVTGVDTWNPQSAPSAPPFRYIDISSIDQVAKAIVRPSTVAVVDAPSRARQLIRRGDVLVSTVRPNLNAVAIVGAEFDGATASTGFTVLRPNPSRLDGRFLYRWVQTPAFVNSLIARATGASYPAVSDRIVRETSIPLPPIEEQRRIAAMLDKADAVRRNRRESLRLLDDFLRSVFLRMFGDPMRNSKALPVARVDYVAECLDSERRPVTASDRVAGVVPYYGANGRQGWIDRALFDEPLVLVAEDGGHFGDPARGVAYQIDGPAWVNNHAHILRPRSGVILVEYLHHALRHYDFAQFISGTTRSKLTQGQLNSATIPLPLLSEQSHFAAAVGATERLRQKMARALEVSNDLTAALHHEAFPPA